MDTNGRTKEQTWEISDQEIAALQEHVRGQIRELIELLLELLATLSKGHGTEERLFSEKLPGNPCGTGSANTHPNIRRPSAALSP